MRKDIVEEYLDAFIGILAGLHRSCKEATDNLWGASTYFLGSSVASNISNDIKRPQI